MTCCDWHRSTGPKTSLTISALDRGTLLHTVLELFVADLIDRGVDVSDPDDYRPLRSFADDVMADYEARGLTGRPVLWRIARRQIAADLDRFIEVDRRLRAARQLRPLAVELSFGLDGHPPAVIELDDGRRAVVSRTHRSSRQPSSWRRGL